MIKSCTTRNSVQFWTARSSGSVWLGNLWNGWDWIDKYPRIATKKWKIATNEWANPASLQQASLLHFRVLFAFHYQLLPASLSRPSGLPFVQHYKRPITMHFLSFFSGHVYMFSPISTNNLAVWFGYGDPPWLQCCSCRCIFLASCCVSCDIILCQSFLSSLLVFFL